VPITIDNYRDLFAEMRKRPGLFLPHGRRRRSSTSWTSSSNSAPSVTGRAGSMPRTNDGTTCATSILASHPVPPPARPWPGRGHGRARELRRDRHRRT